MITSFITPPSPMPLITCRVSYYKGEHPFSGTRNFLDTNMESGSAAISTQNCKKHKATEGEEDTISSKLPEPLISHILSFLSTEDAVCTSVLSKSWINRWTFITRLNLDDRIMLYRKRKSDSEVDFVHFVNRVLLLTQGSNMETVSLMLSKEYDGTLLNTWICGILIRRVKKLCINVGDFPFSPLTSHLLFNSKNYLEEFVLEMWSSTIKVPPCGFVYFSSLKLLRLCEINFTFHSSLVFNLPNLKKFETENCSWVSSCAGSVTVDAPLLETILIQQDCDSASLSECSCAINFTASQLKEVTYYGAGDGVSPPIILPAPSSSRNASANIILFEYYQKNIPETESCAFMLLKQCSQVKSLKFDGLEVLSRPNVLPVFPMLCHLELDFVTCEVLLGLLQKSPFLKTLIVNKEISKFDKGLLNFCVVPECLTYTLQIVKFKDFTAYSYKHKLYLAKLFLQYGTVLERLSFSFARRGKSKDMEKFKEKLFSYKKGFSSFANIEFSYKEC